jgi:hypothetical protein
VGDHLSYHLPVAVVVVEVVVQVVEVEHLFARNCGGILMLSMIGLLPIV